MIPIRLTLRALALLLTTAAAAPSASSQSATNPIGARVVPVHVSAGPIDGSASPHGLSRGPAFRTTLSTPGVSWVRLRFSEASLGSGSYIVVRSVADGAHQRLDARSIEQWDYATAFFNGEAVEVELHVGPADRSASFSVAEAMVGPPPGAAGDTGPPVLVDGIVQVGLQPFSEQVASDPCSREAPFALARACNGIDERVPAQAPAVARVLQNFNPADPNDLTVGGTAWITATGAFLSAGHVVCRSSAVVVEFHVPSSLPDGTEVFAPPEHQYPIDQSSVVCDQVGLPFSGGDDWGVFDVFENSNTGLKPVEAQNVFYRMSIDQYQTGVSAGIYGYGRDNDPAGATGGTNSSHRTLQYDDGPVSAIYPQSFQATIDHAVDNSGSPLLVNGLAIGIDTHGSVYDPPAKAVALCYAVAQRLDVPDVRGAISNFWGSGVVFVDASHPAAVKEGTPFRPYSTLTAGLASAPAGGQIHLVKGSYPGSYTINQAVTLDSKVGLVTIGGSGAFAFAGNEGAGSPSVTVTDEASAVDSEAWFSLSSSYPNPTSGEAVIELSVPTAGPASLVVYDALGREVARPLDRHVTPGPHSVRLDVRGLPSGVYTFRLQAGHETATRRLTVLR